MPHIYMVWSAGNIFSILFWGFVAVLIAFLGLLLLAENIKHRVQRFFGFRK